MAYPHDKYFEICDGEVRVWIEQGESLCIKAVTEFGDPVELTEDDARKIAKALLDMVADIESRDSSRS